MISVFLTPIFFASVLCTTYNVDVGRTGLTFTPSTLYNVAVGDSLHFHFYPSNHSVAESTFSDPCVPKSGGVDAKPIYSGFVPTSDGVASQMFSVTVNSTDPIWLYCSQGSHQHCRNGQVMVVNPLNDTDQTLDAYMQAAQTANVSSPAEVFGGVLVDDDGGQPDGGPQALPTNSLSASEPATSASTSESGSVGATAKPSSGVAAPIFADVVRELSIWGGLAVVFWVTL